MLCLSLFKSTVSMGCRSQGTAGGAGRGWQAVSCSGRSDLKKFLSQVWFSPSEHSSCFYSNSCGRKMPFPRSLEQLPDCSALQAQGIWEDSAAIPWQVFPKLPCWSVLLCSPRRACDRCQQEPALREWDKCQSVASVSLGSQM